MPPGNYRDKVIIVTGASLGIGRALALGLAEQGARLVLAARSRHRLEELEQQCASHGGEAIAVPTDVADAAQCRALAQRAAAHYGGIDALVNNAGIGMIARFDQVQDPVGFEAIMRVNYLGSVYCTYYCLPYLKQSRGHVVAIASLAGRTGVPMYSAYSASKHALIGFFESIRIELQTTGVDVTLILPDFVSSGIHERCVDEQGRSIGKAHNIDYRHAMSTEDCARLCIRAMRGRRREAILSWRGRIGRWVKLIAPGVIDTISAKAIESGR